MGAGEECDDGNTQDGDGCSSACALESCGNGAQDGDETGVDCGGSCAARCATGEGCAEPGDCASGVCEAQVCVCTTWTRQLGTAADDLAVAVAYGEGVGVVVAGNTAGDLGQMNFGEGDRFVARYTVEGDLLWASQIGSVGADSGSGVAVSSDGSIYSAGTATGDVQGEAGIGGADIMVARHQSNGDVLWVRHMGTADTDFGYGMALDADGNIVVSGETEGQIPGQMALGARDSVLFKIDGNGDVIWSRQYGSGVGDFGRGVAVLPEGHIVAAGFTDGSWGVAQSFGGRDMFVARFGPEGSPQWNTQIGGAMMDQAYGVAIGSRVYVAGHTFGASWNGVPNPGSPGGVLQAVNLDGTLAWSRLVAGSGGGTYGRAVAEDSVGGVVLAGATSSQVGSDPAQGGLDVYVARYTEGGSSVWVRQIGTVADDEAEYFNSITTDGKGQIYVVGWTEGDLAGANAGGKDAFVMRLCE